MRIQILFEFDDDDGGGGGDDDDQNNIEDGGGDDDDLMMMWESNAKAFDKDYIIRAFIIIIHYMSVSVWLVSCEYTNTPYTAKKKKKNHRKQPRTRF